MCYITTYSGVHFDLVHPTVEMVKFEDIAHHLSQVCRWAGATRAFWSVAQHSVVVSKIVAEPELEKWALMHDAAEAYIGDITRPLKKLIPGIRDIEARIEQVIAAKFQLPYPCYEAIKYYDDQVQRLEGELFMFHDGRYIARDGLPTRIDQLTEAQYRGLPRGVLMPMSQDAAKVLFHMRYYELFGHSIL